MAFIAAGVARYEQFDCHQASQRRETVSSPLRGGMTRHYIFITADFPDSFPNCGLSPLWSSAAWSESYIAFGLPRLLASARY
jgi:hypothetical protein